MRIPHFAVLTAFAAASLVVASAHAQTQEWKGRYADGPILAWFQSPDEGSSHLGGGWQFIADINRTFSFESSWVAGRDHLSPDWVTGSGLPPSRLRIDHHHLSAGIRTHVFHRENYSVYVLGALSYNYFQEQNSEINKASRNTPSSGVKSNAIEIKDELGWQAGLGIEYSIARHWEIVGEYRHLWHDGSAKVDVRFTDGSERRSTPAFDYNHGQLRIGVNYRF
jgi:opacity protein-like surface antigen